MTTKPESEVKKQIYLFNSIKEYSEEKIPINVDFKYLSEEAMSHYSDMFKVQHPIYSHKWIRIDNNERHGMPVCASPQYPVGRDINHITLYFHDKAQASHFKLRHTGIE